MGSRNLYMPGDTSFLSLAAAPAVSAVEVAAAAASPTSRRRRDRWRRRWKASAGRCLGGAPVATMTAEGVAGGDDG